LNWPNQEYTARPMIYSRINYEHLAVLQRELLAATIAQPMNIQPHTDGHSVAALIEFERLLLAPGHVPVARETLILTTGTATHAHRDTTPNRTPYRWSINIPLEGYEHSHTSFWHTKGRPQGIITPTKTPSIPYSWPLERCKLIDSYATNSIFLMDTHVPHSIHSDPNKTLLRRTYMLRMGLEFDPTQHLLVNYE